MLLKGDLNDNILMGFEMNFTDKGKNILKYSCSSLIVLLRMQTRNRVITML